VVFGWLSRHIKKSPGIARDLKDQLIEWHKEDGNIAQVAALYVDAFLSSSVMKNLQIIERLFQAKTRRLMGTGSWFVGRC